MSTGFTHRDVPDQTGRTVLVTGANTGIGFEAARVLAGRGARVLLGCRSQERASAAMERIREDTPSADVAFVALDQADLASVRAAAREVAAAPRLDVLVNNAGIMMPPREPTEDGFESQFGVNHLGTFALTGLLLEKLAEQPGSRVVVTSSLAHRGGRIHFGDLAAERSYDRMGRYRQSKLANLLFAFELQRRLEARRSPTIAVACHPGIAETDLARHFPRLLVAASGPFLRGFFNSALQGAWPTLMAATSPDVEGGDFVGPSKRGETAGPAEKVRATSTARDEEIARRLWEVSAELTGVDP